MKGRTKAKVPVSGKKPRSATGAAVGAAALALVFTLIAVVATNQTVRAKTASETVWRVVAPVSSGTAIPANAVVAMQAPAEVASYLFTGKSPAGKTAKVTLLPGTLLTAADLGGKALQVPVGYTGVWVATNPNQDGTIAVGEWVQPYSVPQPGVSTNTKAQPLTTKAVQVVEVSTASGTSPSNGGGGASALSSNFTTTGGAPVAVELAVPQAEAAGIIAASANHGAVLAVLGGTH